MTISETGPNKLEALHIGNITETIQDKVDIAQTKIVITKPSEKILETLKITSKTLVMLQKEDVESIDEQSIFVEEPIPDQTGITEEITITEIFQTVDVTDSRQKEITEEISSVIEDIQEFTFEEPIVEENITSEAFLRENSKTLTTTDENSVIPTIIADERIKTVQEQSKPTEKPTLYETIIKEVTATETISTNDETLTITEEIIEPDVSPVIEEDEIPTEKESNCSAYY